jgi:hypothetical protein
LVEHATENRSVGGSIPPLGTTYLLDISKVIGAPLRGSRVLVRFGAHRGTTSFIWL